MNLPLYYKDGVVFSTFWGLFTSCLYKVWKKFWFTEIGLVDFEKCNFEKNAFKVFWL